MDSNDKDVLLEDKVRQCDKRQKFFLAFAVFFICFFIATTTFEILEIQDLESKDFTLQAEIQLLKRKIQSAKHSQLELDKNVKEDLEDLDESKRYKMHKTKMQKTRQANIFAEIFQAQVSVFEKYCRKWDSSCPKGPTGDNGTDGSIGPQGVNGSQGISGIKGARGDPGVPGSKGPTGDKGQRGDDGNVGIDGTVGEKGLSGDVGYPGLNETSGIKGSQGNQGHKGKTGDVGTIGNEGHNGTNGVKGDKGEAGIKGERGTQGIPGMKGQDVKKFADDCDCYTMPTFDDTKNDVIYVNKSGTVTIPYHATANPQPDVTVNNVHSAGKRQLLKSGNTYIVQNAIDSDYGDYICKATNMFGSVKKVVTVS